MPRNTSEQDPMRDIALAFVKIHWKYFDIPEWTNLSDSAKHEFISGFETLHKLHSEFDECMGLGYTYREAAYYLEEKYGFKRPDAPQQK